MVRSVVIEDDTLRALTDRLHSSKSAFECGFMLGLHSASKTSVVAFVPPLADGDAPVGGWAQLDESWVIQHAANVLQMLPGGLTICGVYAYSPGSDTTKHSGVVMSLLRKLARVDDRSHGGLFAELYGEAAQSERVLLQVCSATKKNSVKCFNTADPKGTGGPAELKDQAVMSKIVRITSSCPVTVSLPLNPPSASGGQAVVTVQSLAEGLRHLTAGVVVVDSHIIDETSTGSIATALLGGDTKGGKGKGKQDAPQEALQATMYLDGIGLPAVDTDVEVTPVDNTVGSINVRGCISLFAYAHTGEATSSIAAAIRADLVRSLVTRVERSMLDWSMQEPVDTLAATLKAGRARSFAGPRRAVVPLNGSIKLSEYYMEGEAAADVAGNANEMLTIEVPDNAIWMDMEQASEPADPAPAATAPNSKKGAASGSNVKSSAGGSKGSGKAAEGGMGPIIVGAAVAAVGAVLYYVVPSVLG